MLGKTEVNQNPQASFRGSRGSVESAQGTCAGFVASGEAGVYLSVSKSCLVVVF